MEYAYLLVVKGSPLGAHYPLAASEIIRIGRGSECEIVLTDPLCSRVHAKLVHAGSGWTIVDLESRNGTFVNGEQIQSDSLERGTQVRIGNTELSFQISDQPLTSDLEEGTRATHSLNRDAWIDAQRPDEVILSGFENADYVHELLVLYQLGLRLIGTAEPDTVIDLPLSILLERLRGVRVGFFWRTDQGQFRLHRERPRRNREPADLFWAPYLHLIEQSSCERRAAWYHGDRLARELAGAASKPPEAWEGTPGTVIVPLVYQSQVQGAIAVHRAERPLSEVEFEFVKSVTVLLCAALRRARQQASIQAEHERLVQSTAESDELLGESQVLRTVKHRIARLAAAARIILIRGESGTGKELVARAIHRAGPRADRPLLSVNCAAIPAELMESHLFGHAQGAFTGADRDHPGWFQQADTGTLFLDEIGDLPLAGQAKLLRIIEGHAFQPLGSTQEVQVDVRIILATNRNLQQLVDEGKFRQDLMYRIAGFEIELPPLRERGQDVNLLVEHFLEHFRAVHGRGPLSLSAAARQQLLSYTWPGNIRQLRNVMDSAVLLATGDSIEPSDLPLPLVSTEIDLTKSQSLRIDEWEKRLILQALQKCDGRVPEAAEMLGIGRATLYRKIDEYQIQR